MDFPAPLWPRKPRISPGSTRKLTSRTASTFASPALVWKVLQRCSTDTGVSEDMNPSESFWEKRIIERRSCLYNKRREDEMEGERITIPVEGMTCGACAAHVARALERLEGVGDVSVNLASATAGFIC